MFELFHRLSACLSVQEQAFMTTARTSSSYLEKHLHGVYTPARGIFAFERP